MRHAYLTGLLWAWTERMFSECQHLSDYLIWPHLEWNFSLNSQLHHFLESLNLWYWRGPDSELSDLSIWTLTKTSRGIDQHVPFGSLTFITVCVCAQWLSCIWLFCNPIDCSLPDSSDHGIFQARIVERVAFSYSRGSSWSRAWTHVSFISCVVRKSLYHCTTWQFGILSLVVPGSKQTKNYLMINHLSDTAPGWRCSVLRNVMYSLCPKVTDDLFSFIRLKYPWLSMQLMMFLFFEKNTFH